MTKKEKKLLKRIKKESLTLYTKSQLPKSLVSRIQKLNDQSSEKEVSFYAEACNHYLRVVGYYKKYPLEAQRVEIELCLRMKEKGII